MAISALNQISGIEIPAKSLNAATATGAGETVFFARPRISVGMQIVETGSPATCVVTLEGTIDGVNFTTFATYTLGSGAPSGTIVVSTDVPVIAARANLTTLTGGSSPTVTATILGPI